jgi:hypothetical protein
MAGDSLAITPAGASPVISVNCPADNLQDAIDSAAPGSTLLVSGTCTPIAAQGGFFINKDLTLSGPAILDGGGPNPNPPTPFNVALNVISGTVVLNNMVLQHGFGIFGLGGGLWNSGQLTLNGSTVKNNTAFAVGGVFNMGQLTLNNSSVSNNKSQNEAGGIFNCGANPGFQQFNLCLGPPAGLTLNNSIVSNNVAESGDGGGIWNDPQAVVTLNNSSLAGNTTDGSGNGGGIENHGTATINNSTLSGNSAGAGGGIWNDGTATLYKSIISNNSSTAGSQFFGGGGGVSNGLSNTGTTTLTNCIIRGNHAAFVGGGIFAGGGPVQINNSIVTGNSADSDAGGMLVWDRPTSVANSVFSHNTDQGTPLPDTLPGVEVAPTDYLGLGNNPTFTTTHSIYT